MDDNMEIDSNDLSKCLGDGKTFHSECSQLSEEGGKKTSLSPETPDLDKENIKPVTGLDPSFPSTPESHVFDPFAPGPEEMALAPRKKRPEGSHLYVVRRLLFDCSGNPANNSSEDSEDFFLQDLYNLVVDTYLKNSVEERDSSSQLSELGLTEDFKTPPSLPRIPWISDTCPGAPLKSSQRPRKLFAQSPCRKLSF